MADSNDVATDIRQSGEYKLALCVRRGVVPAAHVGAKNVNLRVSEGSFLAIRLLHENLPSEFTDLSERGYRGEAEENCDRNYFVGVSSDHFKIPPSSINKESTLRFPATGLAAPTGI